MSKRLIPFTLFLFCNLTLWSQNTRKVVFETAPNRILQASPRVPCDDNVLGTTTLGPLSPQSQSTSIPTAQEITFLCAGDEFNVFHGGEALNGDPNPATLSGVGYAIYFPLEPTIDGPDIATILGDPWLLGAPQSADDVIIGADALDPLSGNLTISNTVNPSIGGTWQDVFNGGDPIQLWFAPISFDAIDANGNIVYEGDPAGPCVSIDLDSRFSVVYLNPIEIVNQVYPFGGNNSEARLNIAGGLPEFDGNEAYNFTVRNVDNPTIVGQVIGGPFGDRSFPTISVPQPGTYEIIIGDGTGCNISTTIVFENFDNAEVVFESSGGAFTVGQEVCVDVTTNNFTDVVGLNLAVNWDTSLLQFNRLDFSNGFFNQADINIDPDSIGYAIVAFFDLGLNPNTLPDGANLFTICFIATGEGTTQVQFTDDPRAPLNGPPIEVLGIDATGQENQLGFTFNLGEIIIVDPNSLTPTISNLRDACPAANNGSFELTIVGGEAPYEVALNGPSPQGPILNVTAGQVLTFDNLIPGDYEIIVRANDNGLEIENVEIVEANLFANAQIDSPITCNGDSDGIMSVEVFRNGILVDDFSDFSFIWTNSTGDTVSTNAIASSLPSDPQYTVFVSDLNACTANNAVGLPETNPIQLDLNILARPTCSGVADGSLEVANVVGGLPPFTYNWSNGTNLPTNTLIGEGPYQVSITDANGCQVSDSTQLIATTSINSNPIITDVLCFGENNGTITLTATATTDGVAPPAADGYIYTWSPNAPIATETGIRSLQSDLVADSYTVTITHGTLPAECQSIETFQINQPDSLIIDQINITPVSSCTLEDGQATVVVSGGTIATDYQYAWDDPASQTTATATGLAADSISIFINDDNGCTAMLDTIVGTPPPPVVQFFDNDSLNCADDPASLQVIAAPGRPGVNINQFIWSHDPMLNADRAPNLSPGIYFVTIVDEDQCSTLDSAIVVSPPAITVDNVTFAEPCFEAEDGRISVTLSGGTPSTTGQPYQIAWSNGFDNSILANVAAGSYDLMVTDENGCEFDTTIILNNLPRITVAFAGINGVDCFENIDPADCDGTATATAIYEDGTTGVFDFAWTATGETTAAADQTASTILCAGMQELVVTDGVCQVTEAVEIPSPPQLLFDIDNSVITPASCNGDADGAAVAAATGGTPGYTYDWPDGTTGTNIANLAAGSYILTITDQNACITTHDVIISEPDALAVGIDLDNTNNVICAGDDNGRIQVIVTGGNPGNLIYDWTNNVSNGPSAAGLAPGQYVINVTDTRGCTGSTDFNISEPLPITANISFEPIQCFGFQTTISVSAPAGGNGTTPDDYSFSVDNSPPQPLDIVIPVFGGDHIVSIFDAAGCQVDNTVMVLEPDPVVVEFPQNLVEVDLGSSITLNPTISSSFPIADIIWSPTDTAFLCNSALCDQPTVNPLDNVTYNVLVTDQNGCTAENSILVEVDKNRNVYIPNVFAPNNTGFDTNDRFEIFTGSGVLNINYARVFNRWGTMVAERDNLTPSSAGIEIWDGRLKGQNANQGVYVYIIEVEFIDNVTLLYRGDITLLR